MSDDAYALVSAITVLLYAALLWTRWRQGVIVRRLLKSLEEQEKQKKKDGEADGGPTQPA